jgi:signal peptidase II
MQTTSGTSLSDGEPAAGSRRPKRAHRYVRLFAGVALFAYVADVVTKVVAVEMLANSAAIPVVGDLLTLRLTRNPGAAFSLGTGATFALSVISIVVVIVVIVLGRRVASPMWAIALGLLLGGAAGNLTDRLLREPAPMRGHVVDFLELPNWPVFNLADSAIVLAAGLIILQSFRGVQIDGGRAKS